MPDASAIRQIKTLYRTLAPLMDERLRRQWAASEARSFGRGGVSAVSRATGMSRNTVRRGMAETALRKAKPKGPISTRIRSPEGGRKALTASDPGLWAALEGLVEPMSRGDQLSQTHRREYNIDQETVLLYMRLDCSYTFCPRIGVRGHLMAVFRRSAPISTCAAADV